MHTPLVSVIIPFYKGELYIGEALESVFNQNYPNLEIIIVNDASPDFSAEIFERFKNKIKIINHEKNKGQAAARNSGLKIAQGELIAFLDQDDMWAENHLAFMLPYVEGASAYDFVRGMTVKFFIHADGVKKMDTPTLHEVLMGSGLYKRSVFDGVGLFDETMREGEDTDWTIRLRESSAREKRINDTVLLYRVHDMNHSSTKDFIKDGYMLSIKKKLARARARHV